MAETVTIGGKKIPRNVLLVGGAGVAGIVGYAWWQAGMRSEGGTLVGTPAEPPAPVEPPTDSPGFSVIGGGTPAPTSNAEWTDMAIQRMIALGYDGIQVNSAIGKYLAHQPLTASERDLVQAAIAQAGPPPVGGPYNFISIPGGVQTPGTPQTPVGVKPGAVTGLKVYRRSPNSIAWTWNKAPGATAYNISVVAGSPSKIIREIKGQTGQFYWMILERANPGAPYTIRIRGVGNTGAQGPVATLTSRTSAR